MTVTKRKRRTTGRAKAEERETAYPLGSSEGESARLQRQSDQLRPQSAALVDRIALKPGQAALDLGCGPSGILELLSAAVGPGGRVVGVDANPELITLAGAYAEREGLANVEVSVADARHTGLPADSFDLVHARTVLATVADPAEVVAEMVRLARPGGWVAGQEPDVEHALCYPPHAGWDRLREIFRGCFAQLGGDLLIGRRLTELYRGAGLTEVGVEVHAIAYPAGHSRRAILPDLVLSLRPVALTFELADEAELIELDRVVREHLADPDTLVMPELMIAAWGRKPDTGSGPTT